ncbi:MAG TPA: 16S rRNA (guanine(527)-N(7))-methyltransferase RsmG [Polyangia bacterium]|nr:16S rRNA (guanine(527)-N(7))-methyltransferase RsmG [Polyangia bacterium]
MGPATVETSARRALEALAAEWRSPLDEARTADLLAFGDLLMTWNARINLTGAHTVGELISEHLPDAFAVARAVGVGPKAVVDVGSGGGLPALPLAILRPDLQLTLVEPLAKKVAFLRTAVRELRLTTVSVQCARAEALVPATFDVAMSRATFPPAEWLVLGRRLVRTNGRVLVLTVPGTDLPGRRTDYLEGRRTLVEVAGPECST